MGNKTFGILALVFGIIGFFTLGITGILAIIFGAIGLSKDEEKGLAIAGLILGIISLILGIILIVVLWAWIQFLLSGGGTPFIY